MDRLKLADTTFPFKDGKELIEFIKQCWLIKPGAITSLPKEVVSDYAGQIVNAINTLGDTHMFQYRPEEVVAFMKDGYSIVMTNPDMMEVLGFVKFFPWLLSSGEAGVFEIGSLFVNPQLQRHHIGEFLVGQMSEVIISNEPRVPIISVVTSDNLPSLKLYRRIGWPEVQSTDHYNHGVNGINILEGWGHPSSIFYHPLSISSKNVL